MNRIITLAQLTMAILLAAFSLHPAALAQARAEGTFSLPYQAEWQGRILPAGQYTFVVEGSISHGLVTVRSAGNRPRLVVMISTGVCSDHLSKASFLKVVAIGGSRYIESVGLAPVRTKFIYQVPEPNFRESRDGVASVQSVPVQTTE